MQDPQVVAREVEDRVVVEQAAVEVRDAVEAEVAALRHVAEQRLELAAERGRIFPRVGDEARDELVGQELDVFGEEAEEDADEEVGRLL